MVDDQDKCEWVNISSGTGSHGQAWTKGRKTVVVVVRNPWTENILCSAEV